MACYTKRNTAKGVVWDVRFMADTEEGRRLIHKSGYSSKREAERAVFAYMAKSPSERVAEKVSDTVESAFAVYIESKRGMLAQGTLYNLERNYKRHIAPAFEARKVSSLVKADILKWQSDLWNEKGTNGELLRNGTCKAIRETFAGFTEWVSEVYSIADPFEGVKAPRRREQKKDMQIWNAQEFERFSEACAPEFRELFKVLFYSGCRLGEALALTKSDFTYDTESESYSIHISKSAQVSRAGFEVITPPKNTSSNRIVSLPSFLSESLSEVLEDTAPGQYVFGGERPLCRQRVSEALAQGIELAGLPRIRIHDLRHSHASLLISLGVPITAVSKRLGHSSVNTTLSTYAHCFKDTESALLKCLNSYISEAVPVSVSVL